MAGSDTLPSGASFIDAWTFALELSRPYFAAPTVRELPIEFAVEAKQIGVAMRALHETLAGGDETEGFAADPATHEDLDRWVNAARRSVETSLLQLDRQLSSSDFAKPRVAEAQALIKRCDTYVIRIEDLADSLGDDLGIRIPARGDYELGKVQRTPGGAFIVSDLSGDSSTSADARLEKTSPLHDVAGMLRSFGYASATLAASVEKTSDLPTRELRAGRWERDVRGGFLDGYTGEIDDDAPGILPEDPTNVARLIALFETEKAFSQLSDELNNRPSSAWIAMRGIAKLLAW